MLSFLLHPSATLLLVTYDVAGTLVTLSNTVKLLGVSLDFNLIFSKHVSSVCQAFYFHIRALRHIRHAVSDDTAKSIGQSLVSSRFDYANGVLYGISKYNIAKLQRAQNSLARFVFRALYRISPSPLLEQLHWLPIDLRIAFNIATLTFETLNHGQPKYLGNVIKRHVPGRALRSATDLERLNLLTTKTVISQRGFRIAARTNYLKQYTVRDQKCTFTFHLSPPVKNTVLSPRF